MLEANTRFELDPALKIVNNCQSLQYTEYLKHCVSLLVTGLQYYLQRQQADFDGNTFNKLISFYNQSHFSLLSKTEGLLDAAVIEKLMEPSFNFGLINKLKIAKRFYHNAQKKWNSVSANSIDSTVADYFHIISSALTYCIDIHMDILRFCEAAISSYKRQMIAEEVEIVEKAVKKMELAINFLTTNKKHNLTVREILVKMNLHGSHDTLLSNLINSVRCYVISTKELEPILG